jgi:hypothetical protein
VELTNPAGNRGIQNVGGRWLSHAAFRSVSLCQRERNRADGHKQKHIKRASDKMRFDGGVSLFFHVGSQMGASSLGIKALCQLPTGKHTRDSQNVRKNFQHEGMIA